jgi:hydrogenase nickel incorporation protein HypA/HybF
MPGIEGRSSDRTTMHELSVAQSILDIVNGHVPEDQRKQVRIVRLRIGSQAGIVVDSLLFAFEAITSDTALAHVSLDVELVPFTLHCTECGAQTHPDIPLGVCSACGSRQTEVVAGTEMFVSEVEMEDLAGGSS